MPTSNWRGDPDMLPAWNHAKKRPVRDDVPYGNSGRTLAERRTSSAEALKHCVERDQEEAERQRSLPTLDEKVQAVGEAVITLLAPIRHSSLEKSPMDPNKITDIASNLDGILSCETRAS